MLKSVSANGDLCTGDSPNGHPLPPTTSITQYHNLVYIDDDQASHVGEDWPMHKCDIPSHPPVPPNPLHWHLNRKTSSGSDLVFIEGKALGRVGDSITGDSTIPGTPPCEAVIAEGSDFVFSD